ncbi:hypothetical protein SAICODRAFT_28150 [Saitoella complicata NRRL Y-17804]|uniref:uncharacterized protein n=1 Tax=Saitoella complicata (strain BCRC 22490 / CBS 7301 / JCM 7358 / NBRC 10748 / NRRL Y-17804) TaxID=698492 RepID=UPI0008672C38|nr:uncharacterized protein SAICODRAFT_28150 [Saitoella complicata NRRL Y-17804]ODQ49811.1 hypothetical protein SAICODRAFT_28150 [Saitoella complicata NRRL Y-17804]
MPRQPPPPTRLSVLAAQQAMGALAASSNSNTGPPGRPMSRGSVVRFAPTSVQGRSRPPTPSQANVQGILKSSRPSSALAGLEEPIAGLRSVPENAVWQVKTASVPLSAIIASSDDGPVSRPQSRPRAMSADDGSSPVRARPMSAAGMSSRPSFRTQTSFQRNVHTALRKVDSYDSLESPIAGLRDSQPTTTVWAASGAKAAVSTTASGVTRPAMRKARSQSFLRGGTDFAMRTQSRPSTSMSHSMRESVDARDWAGRPATADGALMRRSADAYRPGTSLGLGTLEERSEQATTRAPSRAMFVFREERSRPMSRSSGFRAFSRQSNGGRRSRSASRAGYGEERQGRARKRDQVKEFLGKMKLKFKAKFGRKNNSKNKGQHHDHHETDFSDDEYEYEERGRERDPDEEYYGIPGRVTESRLGYRNGMDSRMSKRSVTLSLRYGEGDEEEGLSRVRFESGNWAALSTARKVSDGVPNFVAYEGDAEELAQRAVKEEAKSLAPTSPPPIPAKNPKRAFATATEGQERRFYVRESLARSMPQTNTRVSYEGGREWKVETVATVAGTPKVVRQVPSGASGVNHAVYRPCPEEQPGPIVSMTVQGMGRRSFDDGALRGRVVSGSFTVEDSPESHHHHQRIPVQPRRSVEVVRERPSCDISRPSTPGRAAGVVCGHGGHGLLGTPVAQSTPKAKLVKKENSWAEDVVESLSVGCQTQAQEVKCISPQKVAVCKPLSAPATPTLTCAPTTRPAPKRQNSSGSTKSTTSTKANAMRVPRSGRHFGSSAADCVVRPSSQPRPQSEKKEKGKWNEALDDLRHRSVSGRSTKSTLKLDTTSASLKSGNSADHRDHGINWSPTKNKNIATTKSMGDLKAKVDEHFGPVARPRVLKTSKSMGRLELGGVVLEPGLGGVRDERKEAAVLDSVDVERRCRSVAEKMACEVLGRMEGVWEEEGEVFL